MLKSELIGEVTAAVLASWDALVLWEEKDSRLIMRVRFADRVYAHEWLLRMLDLCYCDASAEVSAVLAGLNRRPDDDEDDDE